MSRLQSIGRLSKQAYRGQVCALKGSAEHLFLRVCFGLLFNLVQQGIFLAGKMFGIGLGLWIDKFHVTKIKYLVTRLVRTSAVTGVYKNFACAAGPVFVPANIKPLAKNNKWSVYSMKDSLCIAVYSTSQFGLMIIFEHADANGLLTALIKANPYSERLKQHFRFPGGENIQYDVNAPANRWVIISDNDQLMNREFDQWPLIAGTVD